MHPFNIVLKCQMACLILWIRIGFQGLLAQTNAIIELRFPLAKGIGNSKLQVSPSPICTILLLNKATTSLYFYGQGSCTSTYII